MVDDSAKPAGGKDLFGDPWTPPRDPRGRKRHRRVPEVAEKVAVLRAAGSTQEEIALRIGLSVPTLAKYYFRELEQGSVLAQQLLDEVQWNRAMAGSTPAAKYMRERFTKGAAAVPVPRQVKPTPLGKKDQAEIDAKGAHLGTSWGDALKLQ